jgi:hypothetical protein
LLRIKSVWHIGGWTLLHLLIFVCDSVFLCSVPFISNAKILLQQHNQEQKQAGYKEKSAQVGELNGNI